VRIQRKVADRNAGQLRAAASAQAEIGQQKNAQSVAFGTMGLAGTDAAVAIQDARDRVETAKAGRQSSVRQTRSTAGYRA
jgi:hypothetical protein